MYHVFTDEGNGVGEKLGISLKSCKVLCANTEGCKSFAYCSRSDGKDVPIDEGRCHLKDKEGNTKQSTSKSNDCTSYFEQRNFHKSYL